MKAHNNSCKYVLAELGNNKAGFFLSLIDLDNKAWRSFHVRGKTFSLKRAPQRRCIGRLNLKTGQKELCPLNSILSYDDKENRCLPCLQATGFNPSFYRTDFISPQQRIYNAEPHLVYMAYFSPAHLKVGITNAARGIRRLREQGARAGCVVGRFADAYAARELEAALCEQPGIVETMRSQKKIEVLVTQPYNTAEAFATIERHLVHFERNENLISKGFAPEKTLDFSEDYFGEESPSVNKLQMIKDDLSVCGGTCIGMVGNALLLEQNNIVYVFSLKNWVSHEVQLVEDQVLCRFNFVPQQMSLL